MTGDTPARKPQSDHRFVLVMAGLLGAIILVVWGVATYERSQPSYQANAAAEAEACRAAISTVQQYRAPGQRLTVEANAELAAASGLRPMRLGTWTATVGTANRCYVYLDASVGNERRDYMWVYDRGSGAVTANDDATKRLSGW
jgi:hypothetical protein